MALEVSGERRSGDGTADLVAYLEQDDPDGYPVHRVVVAVCAACSGTTFGLLADDAESVVRRTCAGCGESALMLDSEDYWDDADPEVIECECGGEEFEVAVGFTMRTGADETDEVRWVSVGVRCVRDGRLGYCADWKIDYSPSSDLLDRV
ncbi:hypothetical protein DPM19_08030 [Actinomadura craniellae]|uniref:Uncharacterized protein n=1 Tax=Actinomadura craniellae TaxID=2231787 RepID=A0A365H9A2_9ACTN|nr:hypothetical protein [Actinomadura craniellae]RAY15720.1 hypothetical protein DPM19_08030 [Actinomadura craniellae]